LHLHIWSIRDVHPINNTHIALLNTDTVLYLSEVHKVNPQGLVCLSACLTPKLVNLSRGNLVQNVETKSEDTLPTNLVYDTV
jgi:hypothetical protein